MAGIRDGLKLRRKMRSLFKYLYNFSKRYQNNTMLQLNLYILHSTTYRRASFHLNPRPGHADRAEIIKFFLQIHKREA